MLRSFYLILFSILTTLSLTSCTTMPLSSKTPTVKRSWAERQHILSQLTQYDLSGKIAFKSRFDAGSATLNWKEKRGQYIVSLFGPLGSHRVQITGQKNNVSLETADGKKIHAQNPEALIAKALGYNLPISYLKYWIRGLPVPNLDHQASFDSYHRLTLLTQAGWQIKFLSYDNVGKIELPTKVSLSSKQLQAKIIIYHWQITSASSS